MDMLFGDRLLLSYREVVRVWATVFADEIAVLIDADSLVVGNTDELE